MSVSVFALELSVSYTYTGEKLIISGYNAKINNMVSVYLLEATANANDVSDSAKPVIMEVAETDNSGNFSVRINLPENLPTGRYKINIASGSDIWESNVFYCINLSKLNITTQSGSIQASLPDIDDEDMVMFVAIYDEARRLVRVLSDSNEDKNLSVSIPVEGGNTYVMYLWNDKNLQPYYDAQSGNIYSVE